MKRKLPVLIAIVLALIVALAACQSQNPPASAAGDPIDPAPAQAQNDPTGEAVLPADPAIADTQPSDPAPEEPKLITMDEAIAIALKDAGFKEADVTGLHAELERDDGITIYDVDFYKDAKEFDYEIHAENGQILKPVKKPASTESSSTGSSSTGSSSSGSSSGGSASTGSSSASKTITKDEAMNKALSHAGLKKSQVSRLRAELDKDDGVSVYEVDFETAEWEYEYEINAKTGKIRKAEKDRQD